MKSTLIVDDNPAVRQALRRFIEAGRRLEVCGEAEDGMDAVRRADELQPDLILMDLSMPKMDGSQAAFVIRQTHPTTRIVIFTLYPDVVGSSIAKSLGVDLVIDKSEGAAGLTLALCELLDRFGQDRHA